MPYNMFNKKEWLAELDRVTDQYINLIDKLSAQGETKVDLDLVLNKNYKRGNLVFTGKELTDEIQKKLARDINYTYEFTSVDNKPVIKRDYRIFHDDQVKAKISDVTFKDREGNVHKIKNDNVLITIEDLKSKYAEAQEDLYKLGKELIESEETNTKLFLDMVEVSGGLYAFASRKKWILMLARILKEKGFYKDDLGTEFSYNRLSKEEQDIILETFYEKVYK